MRHAWTWLLIAGMALGEGPLEVRPPARSAAADESAGPSLLRASVNWVRVPVHVIDESGAPRTGLSRSQFEIWENGRRQQIRAVSEEESPVSLAIVFDASSSMEPKLNEARAALAELFPLTLPGDEYALVQFGSDAQVIEDFTADAAQVERAAQRIQLTTWTALYDAVYLGLAQTRHAANARKALLVLSDGGDNNSRYSASELLRAVRESDAAVYSIAIRPSKRHAAQLEKLAAESGGISLPVTNPSELKPALQRMSRLLRTQYVIDYASDAPALDGLWRSIAVRLNTSDLNTTEKLRAYSRGGYYQPQD